MTWIQDSPSFPYLGISSCCLTPNADVPQASHERAKSAPPDASSGAYAPRLRPPPGGGGGKGTGPDVPALPRSREGSAARGRRAQGTHTDSEREGESETRRQAPLNT
ncbi:hypothetical protein SKAU_G00187190 [Synaphobranchus kaupii]|uniref:Uncharacterized protein n=1 Tax=Synaphobranchus kaupii TaxID=118154 RepID=A0A9Q1FD86_SYNKA|nr:hypothetical protein SKAU_G00187190 [Synaphobranchus kaupii]